MLPVLGYSYMTQKISSLLFFCFAFYFLRVESYYEMVLCEEICNLEVSNLSLTMSTPL